MGVISRKRAAMESLCDELLAVILRKLPIPDVIRARAVCRRWRERMDALKAQFQVANARGYCPLVFKRIEEQHTWSGYHGATGKWESLPSLSNVPRVIHLLPIAGSGNGLLGFKIFAEFSGYIVGNPYSQKWTTLPRSADSWGDAAMFMTSNEQDGFRVVAVRDEDTHIYKSEVDMWTRVGCTPRSVQEGRAVSRIRSKVCAAVNNRLYTSSADGNLLISFDMRTEQWTDDRIDIPVYNSAKKSMQLVECAGTLFAVTEEDDTGRISVWGLGMHLQHFSLTVEMPPEIRGYLKPEAGRNNRARTPNPKLRSVGHGQHLFFWRHNSLSVVSYDLFTHEWRKLPEIVKPDIVAADDGPQVTIDAGFFEPKFELNRHLNSTACAESLSSNQTNAGDV